MNNNEELNKIKKFYDDEYYSNVTLTSNHHKIPWHYRLIASRLKEFSNKSVLDVACGQGEWLSCLKNINCQVTGIDLSDKAIEFCKSIITDGNFVCGPAESLPFADASFDLVTCLGALEHFTDKPAALKEMLRVAI